MKNICAETIIKTINKDKIKIFFLFFCSEKYLIANATITAIKGINIIFNLANDLKFFIKSKLFQKTLNIYEPSAAENCKEKK